MDGSSARSDNRLTSDPPRPWRLVRAPIGLLVAIGVLLGVVATALASASASPAGAVITGIDVASHQHPRGAAIDWVQVAGAGHRFAYVKATEGTTYTNPWFVSDYAAVGAVGLYRGAYHYARPALPLSTAEAQARYFVSVAGSATGPMDLPLELDLEETGGLGQADLAEWARRFLAEVTRLTGKRPLVYTGRWFWQGYIGGYGDDIGQNYRLWTADYRCQRFDGTLWCDPTTDTYNPPIYGGWGQWTFWQNYSVGAVPGIVGNVDMNRFCCDIGSLAALAGGGGGAGSPFGSFDTAQMVGTGAVTVTGWAIDPDTRAPIDVHVYVDAYGSITTAELPRPDVAAAYPGFGEAHGFITTVPVPLGAKQVCAYGLNTASGVNRLLGCRPLGGDPFGAIDVAAVDGPGRIAVSGWAIDPNDPTPTRITLRSGSVESAVTADLVRNDLVGFGQGPAHGWSTILSLPTGGAQQVCVDVQNAIGPGSTVALGCRTVSLPSGDPVGHLDVVAAGPGVVTIGGWAFDPDTSAPIDVHVYVDGAATALRADGNRADIAAAFPGYGSAHGFGTTVAAPPGVRNVCVYGIDVGVGVNSLIGCRQVNVPAVVSRAPVGVIDALISVGGGAVMGGWAFDPDGPASLDMLFVVDGRWVLGVADVPRADVAAAFPGVGPNHGFSARFDLAPGPHTVCAAAIDSGGGANHSFLGCRSVTLPEGDPFGFIDAVSLSGGVITASGWAIDPDTTGPTKVHVYVNDVGVELVADGNRPDVGAAFGRGSAHGWSFVGPRVGDGPQRVCIHAIDLIGPGRHRLLGCRTLT